MMPSGVSGFFEGLAAGLNGHFYAVRANYPYRPAIRACTG